jgi:hypothetical protein
MMKLRKDSKIQVSKGNILSFGRRMDETFREVGRRSAGVNASNPSVFTRSIDVGNHREGDGSSKTRRHDVI